jgi:hypothetical protein
VFPDNPDVKDIIKGRRVPCKLLILLVGAAGFKPAIIHASIEFPGELVKNEGIIRNITAENKD